MDHIEQRLAKYEVKPCPCCGNKDLFIGHTSSMSLGIICWAHGKGCNLTLSVNYPERSRYKTMDELEDKLLQKATKRWNKRKQSHG